MAVAYRDNALENRHLYAVMFGAVSVGGLGGRGPDPEVSHAAFAQLVDGVAPGDGRGSAARRRRRRGGRASSGAPCTAT